MKKPTSAMKKPRLSKRPIDNDNHAGHRRYGTFPRMPAKDPKREFKVGDKVRVNLHHGRIEDAVIKAIEHTSSKKLQVDFGHDQTALIEPWQVVDD